MNETTVTKGERYYTIAGRWGIVLAETAQDAANYLWAMKMNARWMIYHEQVQ